MVASLLQESHCLIVGEKHLKQYPIMFSNHTSSFFPQECKHIFSDSPFFATKKPPVFWSSKVSRGGYSATSPDSYPSTGLDEDTFLSLLTNVFFGTDCGTECGPTKNCLVVTGTWLVEMTFPSYWEWNVIIPTNSIIFQRGRYTTHQI